MITESFYEYKGYTIKLRAVTNSGLSYAILKIVDGKHYNLRKKIWDFILPELALQKAKNYIDEFSPSLEEKTIRAINKKK